MNNHAQGIFFFAPYPVAGRLLIIYHLFREQKCLEKRVSILAQYIPAPPAPRPRRIVILLLILHVEYMQPFSRASTAIHRHLHHVIHDAVIPKNAHLEKGFSLKKRAVIVPLR